MNDPDIERRIFQAPRLRLGSHWTRAIVDQDVTIPITLRACHAISARANKNSRIGSKLSLQTSVATQNRPVRAG